MNRFFTRSRSGDEREPNVFQNIQNTFAGLDVNLEKPVLSHLKNVYATVAAGVGVATLGAMIHLFTNILRANFFLTLASIGLMFALISTPHTRENQKKRLGYFLAFCGLNGISMGPLLERVIAIDPSIVLTAFLSTTIVFGCFTMAALKAPTTKFIHLGGTLASASLILLFAVFFVNYQVILWAGLALSVGFVLYDTQMIVEKSRMGDNDYVWHAVEIFIDFVNMFRYIMILLADKENRRENENRRKRD